MTIALRSPGRAWLAALLVSLLAACAGDQEKISAINAVNQGFRVEYEKQLAQKGTRVYPVRR